MFLCLTNKKGYISVCVCDTDWLLGVWAPDLFLLLSVGWRSRCINVTVCANNIWHVKQMHRTSQQSPKGIWPNKPIKLEVVNGKKPHHDRKTNMCQYPGWLNFCLLSQHWGSDSLMPQICSAGQQKTTGKR